MNASTFLEGQGRGSYQNTYVSSVDQYTGLRDKNGKEIYEGDLLMSDKGEIKKVMFSIGSFGFDLYSATCEYYFTRLDGLSMSLGKLTGYVIAGNIYQNPELLK